VAVDLGGRTLGGTTVQALAERVAAAAPALRAIPDGELLAAWNDTLAALLDRGSPERRALEPGLLDSTGLSPEGLHRSLQAIGAGLQGDPAAAVVRLAPKQRGRGFSLVILPATPPGLILQSLLPALAARAPVLFKPSRAEPHFGPAFLAALGQRLPAVGAAFAAANWAGGDRSVEQDLYGRARVVVAYGNDSTIASIESVLAAARDRHLPDSDPRGVWNRSVLRPKAATRFVAFGPKLSLGWVGADADLERAALGMALDVALFDQRGCLSVEAVLVETNVGETAPAAQLPSAAVPHEARETPACRSREFARLLDAALGRPTAPPKELL